MIKISSIKYYFGVNEKTKRKGESKKVQKEESRLGILEMPARRHKRREERVK